MKPNLFIVGEPKCGTTSLVEYLNQHPEIQFSDVKEPRYHASDLIKEHREWTEDKLFAKDWGITEREEYLKLFRDLDTQYRGEASTCYAFSEDAIKNIHGFNSEARIIYCIREPTSWLASYYNHAKRSGAETASSLEEALRLEHTRKNTKSYPYLTKTPSDLHYRERVRFDEHLNDILEVFEKEQVFLVVFEAFKDSNEAVVDNIFDWLGVKKVPIGTAEKNKGYRRKFGRLLKILELSNVWRLPKKYLPERYYDYLTGMISNSLRAGKEEPSPTLRRNFKREFKSVVTELNKMTDEDLVKLWDYKSTVRADSQ